MSNPASQRQHLTKVTGWPGYWANVEGGEITADTTKVYDGGSLKPAVMSGPADTSDVKVSRLWRPDVDGVQARKWAQQVGKLRTTVSRQDTDADLIPIGSPTVYADALLIGLKRPDGDAASSDAAVLELTFAVAGEA